MSFELANSRFSTLTAEKRLLKFIFVMLLFVFTVINYVVHTT